MPDEAKNEVENISTKYYLNIIKSLDIKNRPHINVDESKCSSN